MAGSCESGGAYFCEESAAKIRRTDVRPICSRRAISDLLTPARCSLRIAAVCTAVVAGRPSRFPFSPRMSQTSPGSFPQNLSFELSKDGQRSGHGPSGGRGQIKRLGQGDKPDAQVFEFLKGGQQVRYRPAPAVQAPYQNQIDLAAASGFHQFLAGFSSRRPGVHLADLQSDRPAPSGRILPHGPVLHRESLLVIRGHAGIQARPQHFRRLSYVAKNVFGF